MSEKKGGNVPRRFVVSASADVLRRLKHLAIDMDKGFEKLAGELLEKAVADKEAELAKDKRR